MSATIAALLVGTAAVGGFGLYAGSSSSTTIPTKEEALEEVAKVVEQEDEPSQPTPEPESITPPSTPVPEALPEPVVQGGGSLQKQDGGFGKPTWAPLNSGDSLQSAMGITKDQIGSTGSSLLSKWTGAKTAESIQLKLKEIDDQLRVLKVQKFNTESDIVSKSTGLEQIRTEYLKALTNKTKFEKFGIYYDRELSKLLDPKPTGSDGSLKSIVENKFPKKKDGKTLYPKAGKESETNFDKWLEEAHKHFKTQPDEPAGINPKDDENKDAWWARIGKETSSVNKEPRDIESSLETLLEKKTKNTTLLEQAIQDEQEQKPFYDESIQKLKDLRLKLQNTLKKIKELLDTRELVLVELSNYELPKGMFESFIKQKPIQKPLLLPTGQERDKIFAQIKDLEKQLKNIEEQINDEIDLQLNKNPNWKPKDDKSDEYSKLVNKQIELKDQRDNKILELEGRSEKQKELLESYRKRFDKSLKQEETINPIEQAEEAKKKAKQLEENIGKKLKEHQEIRKKEEKQLPTGASAPQQIAIKMEGGNPKVEGPFKGGSISDIQKKLKALYDIPDPNPYNKKLGAWAAGEANGDNEFFYIMTADNSKIVGAVRICNSTTGTFPLELGMDFIDPAFRGRALYRPLLKARLKHIIDNKTSMYVAYTEFDRLKDIHVELGMTQTPSTKVTINATEYWRLEYNRDPRTLVVTTRFPEKGICSGIAIGNDKIKEFVYTATHCLQVPGTNHALPINIKYPSLVKPNTNPKFPRPEFFNDADGAIQWNIPVKTYQPPAPAQLLPPESKTYTEDVDDVAVLNTTVLLDTSNVFFFDNVEDIPERYAMKKWGFDEWGDTTIDTEENVQAYINDPSFAHSDLDKNYPDWKTNKNKYFRLLTKQLRGGNSGGPHGVFFNRTTGVVGPNEKCYAIVGTTSNGRVIISASHWITWLISLGIQLNIAHYNANGTITIVQPPPAQAEAPPSPLPAAPEPAAPPSPLPAAAPEPAEEEELRPVKYKKKFIADDNFIYEGKQYNVSKIINSDFEDDTMEMIVKDDTNKFYKVKFKPNRELDFFKEMGLGSSRKNHLTRKQQWTRSKPSRFKTHRIY